MVEMRGTPVILILIHALLLLLHTLRVVMQKPRLGGTARLDHMLQIPQRIAINLLLSKTIHGPSDKDGDVDDEATQSGERGLEPRQRTLGRPDVGGQVLGEGGLGECRRGFGALEGRVDVEGAVGVVGALEGVDLAVLEGLFAEGPAGEVLGLYIFQLLFTGASLLIMGFFSSSNIIRYVGLTQLFLGEVA